MDFLRSVSSHMTLVQGDLDDVRSSSIFECIQIEGFRIGVYRGSTCVAPTWVDVLVKGNIRPCAPYRNEVGQIVIQPGSASGFQSDVCSFVLMDIKGDTMVCYWYSVPTGICDMPEDVRVEKFEFSTTPGT